jgi:hypothetical protein
MTSITLEVQSAKLTSTFGSGPGGASHNGKWTITSDVELHWPERLELGTGEDIGRPGRPAEIEMYLTFRATKPELVQWATERTKGVDDTFKSDDDVVCGTASYYAEWNSREGLDHNPASIGFDIYTPPDVMASLVRFAENGRFVKRVTVELRGMDYGWSPDGSAKKWLDNADNKMLPIVNVSYDLPLLEQPEDEPGPGEPTTPVGADLAPVLKETLKWLKGAVLLLAAIAGAVVFAKWR